MTTASQKKASIRRRPRTLATGLSRIEIEADKSDTGLIRALAERLRGDPAGAEALRSVLQQALIDREVESAFDIFGSDLPDEAFAGVFERPREDDWRRIEL